MNKKWDEDAILHLILFVISVRTGRSRSHSSRFWCNHASVLHYLHLRYGVMRAG